MIFGFEFDFEAFQKIMKMLSREKILFHMLFGASHGTPRNQTHAILFWNQCRKKTDPTNKDSQIEWLNDEIKSFIRDGLIIDWKWRQVQIRSMSDPPLSDIDYNNKQMALVWSPDSGLPWIQKWCWNLLKILESRMFSVFDLGYGHSVKLLELTLLRF